MNDRLGPDTAAIVRFLGSAAAHERHAGRGTDVRTIETHMSWVFLLDDHVLKLKKPVRYAFLDFSTLDARAACCREEVRLNARLAPGVYRGLMVLQSRAGRLSLAPAAEADPHAVVIDWLVWMRRLPAERMLDRLIADGRVTEDEVDALAGVLSRFYRHASRVDVDPDESVQRLLREQAVSREILLRPQFALAGAADALQRLDAALRREAGALQGRASGGHVVDGHGDLRPEHVCLLRPPVVIDCLEFNALLRQVDPYDELAFLALECDIAGAPWIGARLVAGCIDALGAAPPTLMPLYTAYRGLLRARLAVAHLLDPQPRTPERWLPLAQRYVTHALQALDGADHSCRSASIGSS